MSSEVKLLNKSIKILKTSDLKKYQIKIPNIQRIIDRKKVDEIVEYQLNQIKIKGKVNFLGVISINECHEDNNIYLVDGQHRYNALLRLFDDHSQDSEVYIEIVRVKDLCE